MAAVNPLKDSCYTIVWDGGPISKSGYTIYPKREAYMSLSSAKSALFRLIDAWISYYYTRPMQKDSKQKLLEAKVKNKQLLEAISRLEIKRYVAFDSIKAKPIFNTDINRTYDGRKWAQLRIKSLELEDA